MRMWALGGLLIVYCLTGPTSATEVVNLDEFIARIEKGGGKGCRAKGLLADFARRLGERYSFEQGIRRTKGIVSVPKPFMAAIGKARAENQGEFTVIRVPLVGSYRGLRTREVTIFAGHSNGVNATHILFEATKEEVERVIGDDLAQIRRAFSDDEIARDFGFRAEIVNQNGRANLICDTST